MAALPVTTAIALAAFLAPLLYLYRLAFRRRPYPGIPHNPRSTRRLLGDIPELTAEARRAGDPARMTGAQFAALGSPVIQLFLMPLWRPMVYLGDTREAEDLLQNRTREFDKAPATVAPFRPLVPGASICKVKGPLWRAQVRLWTDIISPGFLRDQAAPVMHRSAAQLVELFRAKAAVSAGRPFYAAEDFKIATFDVIWKAMLGSDQDGINKEREAVLRWADVIKQPGSKDEPSELAMAPKSDEWEAAVYFLSLVPSTLMSPIPGLLHFVYSLTPTWRKHWATKKHLMQDLIRQSKERFADLGDAKNDDNVAEARDICALDRALRKFAKVSPTDIYRPTTDDMYDELFLLLMSVSSRINTFTAAPAPGVVYIYRKPMTDSPLSPSTGPRDHSHPSSLDGQVPHQRARGADQAPRRPARLLPRLAQDAVRRGHPRSQHPLPRRLHRGARARGQHHPGGGPRGLMRHRTPRQAHPQGRDDRVQHVRVAQAVRRGDRPGKCSKREQ